MEVIPQRNKEEDGSNHVAHSHRRWHRAEGKRGEESEKDLELCELCKLVVRVLQVRVGQHVQGGGAEADQEPPEELSCAATLGEQGRDANE
jgi:hypothetical protein